MFPSERVYRTPTAPTTPPPPPPVETYKAREGDTLNTVAERFGVSQRQITDANPGAVDPDRALPADTEVNIPTGEGDGLARTVDIGSGESPADIATANNISETALREANGLGPGEAVYPGRMLLIPARAEAPDPTTPNGLTEAFPSLAGRSAEDLQGITDNVAQLRDGDTSQKIQALAELARDLQPEQLGELFTQLGIADNPVAQLATDSGALTALSTLANADASAVDKVSAALTLTNSLGSLVPGQLGETLSPYLSALPSGTALIDAINTYTDPDASALDKAKATLNLADAARTSVGDAFPQLAQRLRSTESFTRTLSAGLTLIDPEASLQDKAQAAIELAAGVPEMAGDARAIADFLRGNGVRDADQILQEINRLPIAERLPESLRSSLDPEVARTLTPEQANQLSRLAANGELTDALPETLQRIRDPDAMRALLTSLDGTTDVAAQRALLTSVAGLKEGVADRLLTSTIDGRPAGEMLTGVLGKLDADGQAKFAALIADLDGDSLKFALQLGDSVDGRVLGEVLGVIGDGKLAGQALRALSGILDRAGVTITAEVAEKVFRGLAKMVPIAGALPAAYDAARMAEIAADTSLPPDIRFLALQGAKLNGADAALSVAEPFIAEFFGIPVAADIAIGVASLGIDLVVSDQQAKFEQQGDDYQAPDWLQALNVGLAVSQGPAGAAELALIYGPNGAVDLLGAVTRLGGEGAIKATELQATLAAQGVGEGLHYTAEGLHLLADMIRNPSKYGEAAVELGKQAVEQLSEIAEGASELAQAAARELGNLVDDLKNLGAEGVEALGWIASHPGEAAEKAIEGLSNAAEWGLRQGTEAGKAITREAIEALSVARDALGTLGDAAEAALSAIDGAIDRTVNAAIALGERGIETLGWIANNPGAAAEIAKDALVDVASEAGELAQAAYDQVVALGEDGVELAKDIAGNLVDAGEAGVEMLKYVVENPGEAAAAVREVALDGLATIANGVGAAAEAATDAVVGFVDNGIEEAKATASALLTAGGEAAQRIASAWANELSEGAEEVISGLADVGDAGLDALNDLKNAGVGFAGNVLGGIGGAAKDLTGKVSPWW